ncbi:hypothetical protein [Clostridium intestinale]|uniref:YcxB-like protein domain-containing protein n=1 Tax=Clostridium intestinale URNW TaxID=1294142 RepID=U2NJC7_9CLOT|nr:hypothetical protein [Clostridium intestinale]ERK28966.1 hypothetical protein CINTURNW_3786 [Clostridium intestinale URNW]
MLYEYEINENLSMKDVENIFLKSKVIRRICNNVGYLIVTIGLFIISFITAAITKFRWDNGYLILIVCCIISMCMVLFSRRDHDIKRLAKGIEKRMGTNLSIEINDNKYIYRSTMFTVELTKKIVMEIIVDENYILIVLLPRKFKNFIMVPILIPKNIFESKEELDRFINIIS